MDRKTYKTALHGIIMQAHDLHTVLDKLIDATGADASHAEWNLLYDAMRHIGAVTDALRDSLDPRPSALTDDEPLTDVPMVCTVCRKPVVPAYLPESAATHLWQHLHSSDAEWCANNGPGVIKAMVAAGNERIPFDLAKPATSERLNDA